MDGSARINLFLTYALLTLSAVFWGGTFIAGRLIAPLLDPFSAAFLRFAIAAWLLLAWLWWQHRRLPAVTARQFFGIVLLGTSGIFAYNLMFFSGLQTVEAGRASLIIAANPVLLAITSAVIYRESLSCLRWLGIGMSVFGAMLVITRGEIRSLLDHGIGHGELLILGCVVSWVVYTLIGKRLLRGMSPLQAVTYASVVGVSMLGAMQAHRRAPITELPSDPVAWLSLLYLAVFGTVLAFVWYYKGVQSIGAARAGQFINLVPLSGVALGAAILNEPITAYVLVGGALVLFGLWLTNRRNSA